MNIIAIDCGASFIKGACFEEGVMVKTIERQAPEVHGDEDVLEVIQVPSLIAMVQDMISELIGEHTEVSLCISNEMHGFLLAYADGTPYTDYISWQKEYGAIELDGEVSVEILKKHCRAEDILQTGMPIRGGLPSSNLLYLSRSGYIDKANEDLYFYTLGDYILRMISGKEIYCHPTNAAATGLFDLRTGNWNMNMLQFVCGDKVVFPKIGEKGCECDFQGCKVHILPAIGDQQGALLGAGLLGEHAVSFNLGTGAQVSKLVQKPECSTEYQIRPYFGGMYLKTLPHLPSGRAMNVYIRFIQSIYRSVNIELSENQIWDILLQAGAKGCETGMTCDMSFFENPLTDSVVGSITHISEYSLTLENLMCTILTQMSVNFIKAADRVEEDIDNVKQIIFSGGIARKIEQIRSHIVGHYQNVQVMIAENETLYGLMKYGQEER